jgi:S-methylmethionine-dependent homocysteine/selenocysteine methylase
MSRAEQHVVLLDGGLGRELARRGFDLPDAMWSGAALLVAPELVGEVHRAFLEAGADVITANTYGVTPVELVRAGLRSGEHEKLISSAIEIAREAIVRVGRPARVAGSVGPAGRSYRPDTLPDRRVVLERFDSQVAALVRAGVDIVLGETLSSLTEADAFLEACANAGVREAWVGFALASDGRLRTGEQLATVAPALIDAGASVVLANCCGTEAVAEAANRGWPATGRWGFYCNALAEATPDYSFEVDGPLDEVSLSPRGYAEFCASHLERGVSVIGGCCGIGPPHITELRRLIDQYELSFS